MGFDWTTPQLTMDILFGTRSAPFWAGTSTSSLFGQQVDKTPVNISEYKLPSQAPKSWYDQATGLTMNLVASSDYFDVQTSGDKKQGTRVDIYKVSLGKVDSPFVDAMPRNLRTQQEANVYNLPMPVFPTSYEVYSSKVARKEGKVVQKDKLIERKTVPYENRVEMGKAETPGVKSKGETLRTYYQNAWDEKFKAGTWWK